MRTRLLSFSLAVAIAGCGGGGGSGGDGGITPPPPVTPAQPVATTSVSMKNTAFNPAAIVVSPGATVTWTNDDGFSHNATFSNAAIGGTTSFATGSQSLVMPATPGTYAYTCTIHGGMNGTVKVQ
jgi:plastocyanin